MTFAAPWALLLLPAFLWFAGPFAPKTDSKGAKIGRWGRLFGRLTGPLTGPFHFLSRISRKEQSGADLPFLSPIPLSKLAELAAENSWKVRVGERGLSVLRICAWIFLVLALARPQRIQNFDEAEMTGRDIMLTLDLSGSMQALDFELEGERKDRLTVLKFVTKDFVDSRQGDRIGLVVFGDHVFVQCPLTTDKEAVKRFIDALEISMAGSGTAIGDAIIVSLKRLKNIPENSKTILLVTDGKSNAGSIQPEEAAKLAKQLGVKIHVIGIGGNGTAPFPIKDMFGITRLVPRPVDYDDASLTMIANTTGGKYFNAKNTDQFQEIYAEIDRLEKRVTKGFMTTRVDELFPVPLIAGALTLFLAELTALTTLRKAIL